MYIIYLDDLGDPVVSIITLHKKGVLSLIWI